jgi:outer membrane protein OmpA-like peptidoglycan-associated protein
MKKIFLILALIMLSITTYGQEKDYNDWAVSVEYGNQMIGDKTAVTVDNFHHLGAGVRYNINEIVGVGLTGAYDFTSLVEELPTGEYGTPYDFEYTRFNVEGYINAFKVVDLYSKNWTVLFHGGPGVGFIKGDSPEFGINKETVLNVRGGVSLLYKLSKQFALYGDFSTTSNIQQKMKFDGSGEKTNTGMSSNISNASVGLKFYLGKRDKDDNVREHADWYQKPDIVPVINETKVYNEYVTHNHDIVFTQEEFNKYYANYVSLYPPSQFVFFDHDKYDIRDTELNAIYKIYTELEKNPSLSLVIKGFASPTSSSDEYNLKLSENRSNELYQKFVDMGIDKSRISFEYFGKDKKRSSENVFDVARRVELIVKK